MSRADTIRRLLPFWCVGGTRGAEVYAALDALEAEIVGQADRIAWLEGEVAGWRIKLAECEERSEKLCDALELRPVALT